MSSTRGVLCPMPTRRIDVLRFAAAVALGLSLVACGSSAEKARAEIARHLEQQKRHPVAAPPMADADADMVNAASPGGPGPPISLKFSLAGRPVAGEPLVIHIALRPDSQDAIRHLYGSFTPGDGLLLQSQHTFELRDLADGVPLHQDVAVVPLQVGILSLTATLIASISTPVRSPGPSAFR
jgi:hypothetical protein